MEDEEFGKMLGNTIGDMGGGLARANLTIVECLLLELIDRKVIPVETKASFVNRVEERVSRLSQCSPQSGNIKYLRGIAAHLRNDLLSDEENPESS